MKDMATVKNIPKMSTNPYLFDRNIFMRKLSDHIGIIQKRKI
jgi:hypothetical protein